MFSHFKIKISLWYALLFTVILGSTLFVSYKIVGIQLKNEITSDIKSKALAIKLALSDKETSEEYSGEHGHGGREGEGEEEESSENREEFGYLNLQLLTDIANENYILFIYTEGDLIYVTNKYESASAELVPFEIPDGKLLDVTIGKKPFCMAYVNESSYSVYLGYELSSISDLQKKLLNIFLIIFPIGLFLSVICGFWVTDRSMKVINRINLIADKITSNNLSERINVPKGGGEINNLIGTLNSMIDRLEKSFAQAKQFSQDAAHEIRTPLTIIRGEIEQLIETESVDENSSRTLENILEEIQYLSSISDRLLLIHTMDTTKIKYHFEKVDLSVLMNDIYQDLVVISSEKHLKTRPDIPENIKINCNKELITRLLWNIVDNSVKYNKAGGSVIIELIQESSNVIIKVIDTGIGIPTEEITKIFDRFYRVDKSRSRELGGSGLGLAICKWIADLHNGEIKVESEQYKGSVFSVVLPT